MMPYNQAVLFLSTLTDYEKIIPSPCSVSYDLRRVDKLLADLGNPHRGRITVHIAGTKGKGSVSIMISSILTRAGYNTGLYTSPHLYSWQERIRVNNRMITKRDFTRLLSFIKPSILNINRAGQYGCITTFEALTALAFLYFSQRKADVQVLEVGLGGRLDSTNVVNAEICIITSISLDHTAILGDTLQKIAIEKAGIIKQGSIVISAPQVNAVATVIKEKCHELNARLLLAGRDFFWQRQGGDLAGQQFKLTTMSRDYNISIPLLGDYQMENSALAITAIEMLEPFGFNPSYREIVLAMSQLNWPARMQVLQRKPLLLIDGAHNVYSLTLTLDSLKKYFEFKKSIVIFGVSADKDVEGMAGPVAGFADVVILTTSKHPRAAPVDRLHQIFSRVGVKTINTADCKEALLTALNLVTEDDIILAIGSLFLAAEIKTEFDRLSK